MAYGELYNVKFYDPDENKFQLQIYEEGYVGDISSNLTLGANPVVISYQQDNDYFKPIIGSSCKLQFYVEEGTGGEEWELEDTNWNLAEFLWNAEGTIDFLEPQNDRQFKVVISYQSDTDVYTTYWTGFIIQDSFTAPLQPFPFIVEAYASDLIGTIDGYNYGLATETPTCFDAIRECLKDINLQNGQASIGKSLDFGYKVLCRIKPTGESNGNPFLQTYVMSKDAMQDENGNAIDNKTILESLLQMFNCRIFQHEGRWTIISNDAMSLSSFDDEGGSYNKEFLAYTKAGVGESNIIISNPVKNINSTQDDDTLQPLNADFIKITKRPAIRNRTNIRIKDLYKNEFNNGGFEIVTSPSGSTPSWGFIPQNWTIAPSQSSTSYCVDSDSADTSQPTPIVYGITPYGGTYSFLMIGTSTSTPASPTLTNATGDTISATGTPIKFSFAVYAADPNVSGLLAYEIRWRLKVGTSHYWDVNNDRWTTASTINTSTGALQDQWLLYEFNLNTPQSTGTITIDFYTSKETAYGNSDFRTYFDDVKLTINSDMEYFTSTTSIDKSEYKSNSGVIPSLNNRFGMIEDDAYVNCLVNSSNLAISSYTDFDLSSTWKLENLMELKRLNDLTVNNNRYEGTFRKLKLSTGFLDPIDMLTFPKLNFTNLSSVTDQMAIDNLEYSISKNRIKLSTHTSRQGNLTVASDINQNRSFYEYKPKD